MKARQPIIAVASLAAVVGLTASTAFASSGVGGNSSPAEQALAGYLNAVEQQNYSQMIADSIDTRFAQQSDRLQAYERSMTTLGDTLQSYSIGAESDQGNTDTFDVTLHFENQKTQHVPFDVALNNGQWQVLITPFNGPAKGKKPVSEKGTPVSSVKNSTIISPMSTEVASWNWWNRLTESGGAYVTFYSNATFDANDANNNVCTLNLQQSDQISYAANQTGFDQSNVSTAPIQVQYAVVVQHWYGDYVWGNPISVNGAIYGGAQKFEIYGDGTNPAGCQVRFTFQDPTGENYAQGFGEIYNGY